MLVCSIIKSSSILNIFHAFVSVCKVVRQGMMHSTTLYNSTTILNLDQVLLHCILFNYMFMRVSRYCIFCPILLFGREQLDVAVFAKFKRTKRKRDDSCALLTCILRLPCILLHFEPVIS